MVEVVNRLCSRESGESMLEDDPLLQLPDRRIGELHIQLRLPEQNDLDQLALLGLQIGQQTHRFQGLDRHRLRFIQA